MNDSMSEALKRRRAAGPKSSNEDQDSPGQPKDMAPKVKGYANPPPITDDDEQLAGAGDNPEGMMPEGELGEEGELQGAGAEDAGEEPNLATLLGHEPSPEELSRLAAIEQPKSLFERLKRDLARKELGQEA